MREQTGGASLRRGALKVAHRIRKERLCFFLDPRFQSFKERALIRIRRLVRVMDENEGQIFSAEIGWYRAIAPHVMTILLVVAGVFFVLLGRYKIYEVQ